MLESLHPTRDSKWQEKVYVGTAYLPERGWGMPREATELPGVTGRAESLVSQLLEEDCPKLPGTSQPHALHQRWDSGGIG